MIIRLFQRKKNGGLNVILTEVSSQALLGRLAKLEVIEIDENLINDSLECRFVSPSGHSVRLMITSDEIRVDFGKSIEEVRMNSTSLVCKPFQFLDSGPTDPAKEE